MSFVIPLKRLCKFRFYKLYGHSNQKEARYRQEGLEALNKDITPFERCCR